MSSSNPFDAIMAQAQEMAKAMNPALEAFRPVAMEKIWPTLPKEVMEMSFGSALNDNGLDAKTRLLLGIAGLTMQGAQNELAMRLAVRHAREAGARDEEILETIAQMSVFAGVPAMTKGLEIARSVLDGDKETAI